MLIKHLPLFMREIKEISAIMQAEDNELNAVSEAVRDSLDRSFIMFTDSQGLECWKRLFGVSTREAVCEKLSDKLSYTYNSLKSTLAMLYGNGLSVETDYANYTVRVFLQMKLENSFASIQRLVRERIPANMKLEVIMVFTKHRDLKSFTHGGLRNYTHLQIKRGDFI